MNEWIFLAQKSPSFQRLRRDDAKGQNNTPWQRLIAQPNIGEWNRHGPKIGLKPAWNLRNNDGKVMGEKGKGHNLFVLCWKLSKVLWIEANLWNNLLFSIIIININIDNRGFRTGESPIKCSIHTKFACRTIDGHSDFIVELSSNISYKSWRHPRSTCCRQSRSKP